MTAALPLTIANPLFRKLESLFQLNRPTTIFDTNSLKHEADKLAKTDAASACIVRAGLAALNWDLAETEKQTQRALQLAPNEANVLHNSAINFRQLNEIGMAANYAQQALSLATNNKMFLTDAYGFLSGAGYISDAYQILLDRLHMGLNLEDELSDAKFFSQCIKQLGIQELQIQTEIQLAMTVLRQHQLRFVDVVPEMSVFAEDEQPSLSIQIGFLGDFETEMQLESDLASRLIDLPGWDISKLSVEFSHISQDELQTA